jgi:hypothetical protein
MSGIYRRDALRLEHPWDAVVIRRLVDECMRGSVDGPWMDGCMHMHAVERDRRSGAEVDGRSASGRL